MNVTMNVFQSIQDGIDKVQLLRLKMPLYQDPLRNLCPSDICEMMNRLSPLHTLICVYLAPNEQNVQDLQTVNCPADDYQPGDENIMVAPEFARLQNQFDTSRTVYEAAQENVREAVKVSLSRVTGSDGNINSIQENADELSLCKLNRNRCRMAMFRAGQLLTQSNCTQQMTQLLNSLREVKAQFILCKSIHKEVCDDMPFSLAELHSAVDSVLKLVGVWEKQHCMTETGADIDVSAITKMKIASLGQLLCGWGNVLMKNAIDESLPPLKQITIDAIGANRALQAEIKWWEKDPMADFPLQALIDLYPIVCAAIPKFERALEHAESVCAQARQEIESIEPWLSGQIPEFKVLTTLKNVINAKKTGLKYQLIQARHKVELAEAELDDDVTNSDDLCELRKAETSIKLTIFHNKRLQSHELATIAKIAENHFPEILLEHPDLRLFADELSDVASGCFIPGRTLADYSHLDRHFFPASRHTLWRGSYGGQLVVLKEYSFTSSAQMRSARKEARLLAQHDCEHIVKANCILIDGLKAYIELPFYSNGSMDKFLEKQGKDLSELTKRAMLRKVCCAIQYLHSRQIVHGDIKLENILIANDGMPLLADFDLCRELDNNSASNITTIRTTATIAGARGTIFYMAPELFVEATQQSSKSSDMYAFCICILLVFGYRPTRSCVTDVHTVDTAISQARLKFVIEGLLKHHNRFDATEVLRTVFLSGVETEALIFALNSEKQLKEVQEVADVKLATEIAEAQMRLRSCCICSDDVDVSDGMECKHENNPHFTCNECFNNNVKSFATKPLGSRRWMKVWNHKKNCEQIIQCTEEAIRKEFDIQGDGRNKPFPSLHSDTFEQFSHLFQPLDTYKKQLCVFCPMHGHGCSCEPISEHDIMMHITPAVLAQYQRSRDELMEWRLTAEFEERMRVDRARIATLSAEERRVLEIKHYVVENILNLCCPRADCRQAFVDFDGCFALTCSRCKCGFCAYCLSDCGGDAHAHVAACPHNTAAGRDYFGTVQSFHAAQKIRRRRMLNDHLTKLDPRLRQLVGVSLQRELQDLEL